MYLGSTSTPGVTLPTAKTFEVFVAASHSPAVDLQCNGVLEVRQCVMCRVQVVHVHIHCQ